jgi:putative addiction module killer protein
VLEIIKSATFDEWLSDLNDRKARARVLTRIDRLALGNPGDVKPVGGGVSEMRIDYGPGYRVYYAQHGPVIAILLCGGDKSTQDADIRRAQAILKEWKG